MMEFAKVVSVVHSSCACGLSGNFPALGLDRSDLQAHWIARKCFYFLSFSILFAGLRAPLYTVKTTAISSQMAKSRMLACLVFFVLSAIASSLCRCRFRL